jgi:hypothetical protein
MNRRTNGFSWSTGGTIADAEGTVNPEASDRSTKIVDVPLQRGGRVLDERAEIE